MKNKGYWCVSEWDDTIDLIRERDKAIAEASALQCLVKK